MKVSPGYTFELFIDLYRVMGILMHYTIPLLNLTKYVCTIANLMKPKGNLICMSEILLFPTYIYSLGAGSSSYLIRLLDANFIGHVDH